MFSASYIAEKEKYAMAILNQIQHFGEASAQQDCNSYLSFMRQNDIKRMMWATGPINP